MPPAGPPGRTAGAARKTVCSTRRCYNRGNEPSLRKIIRTTIGVSLVFIGVLGLILPVMPGWVFLIPGLVILSDHFPWLRRLLGWARKKAEPYLHRTSFK